MKPLYYFIFLFSVSLHAFEHLPIESGACIIDQVFINQGETKIDKKTNQKLILNWKTINKCFKIITENSAYYNNILKEKIENYCIFHIFKDIYEEKLPHILSIRGNRTTQNLYNDIYIEKLITHKNLCYEENKPLYGYFTHVPELKRLKQIYEITDIDTEHSDDIIIDIFESPKKNKICFIDCDYGHISDISSFISQHDHIKRIIFTKFTFNIYTKSIKYYLSQSNKNIIFQDRLGSTILHLIALNFSEPFSKSFTFDLNNFEINNHLHLRDHKGKLALNYAKDDPNCRFYNFIQKQTIAIHNKK